MPFKSEKQRRYLYANEPEIAKKWEAEYHNSSRYTVGSNPQLSHLIDGVKPNTTGQKIGGRPVTRHQKVGKTGLPHLIPGFVRGGINAAEFWTNLVEAGWDWTQGRNGLETLFKDRGWSMDWIDEAERQAEAEGMSDVFDGYALVGEELGDPINIITGGAFGAAVKRLRGAKGALKGAQAANGKTFYGYHLSNDANLKQTDPSKFGTGARGDEKNRLIATENQDIRDRTYFYLDGTTPETSVSSVSHHRYQAKLENVYDSKQDPDGFKEQAREMGGEFQSNMERLVKEAGYGGMTGNVGGKPVAIMWNKVDVEPQKLMNQGELAQFAKREAFTVSPTGVEPTSGWAVAGWHRSKELNATSQRQKIQILQEAQEKALELTNKTGETHYVGGWHGDDGRFAVDVVVIKPTKEEAMRLARLREQDGIFHLDEKQYYDTAPPNMANGGRVQYASGGAFLKGLAGAIQRSNSSPFARPAITTPDSPMQASPSLNQAPVEQAATLGKMSKDKAQNQILKGRYNKYISNPSKITIPQLKNFANRIKKFGEKYNLEEAPTIPQVFKGLTQTDLLKLEQVAKKATANADPEIKSLLQEMQAYAEGGYKATMSKATNAQKKKFREEIAVVQIGVPLLSHTLTLRAIAFDALRSGKNTTEYLSDLLGHPVTKKEADQLEEAAEKVGVNVSQRAGEAREASDLISKGKGLGSFVSELRRAAGDAGKTFNVGKPYKQATVQWDKLAEVLSKQYSKLGQEGINAVRYKLTNFPEMRKNFPEEFKKESSVDAYEQANAALKFSYYSNLLQSPNLSDALRAHLSEAKSALPRFNSGGTVYAAGGKRVVKGLLEMATKSIDDIQDWTIMSAQIYSGNIDDLMQNPLFKRTVIENNADPKKITRAVAVNMDPDIAKEFSWATSDTFKYNLQKALEDIDKYMEEGMSIKEAFEYQQMVGGLNEGGPISYADGGRVQYFAFAGKVVKAVADSFEDGRKAWREPDGNLIPKKGAAPSYYSVKVTLPNGLEQPGTVSAEWISQVTGKPLKTVKNMLSNNKEIHGNNVKVSWPGAEPPKQRGPEAQPRQLSPEQVWAQSGKLQVPNDVKLTDDRFGKAALTRQYQRWAYKYSHLDMEGFEVGGFTAKGEVKIGQRAKNWLRDNAVALDKLTEALESGVLDRETFDKMIKVSWNALRAGRKERVKTALEL